MTAEYRRRWATLTSQQLVIAEDLRVRAERLLDGNPDLTCAEAIDIAAIQAGHFPQSLDRSPAESQSDEPDESLTGCP